MLLLLVCAFLAVLVNLGAWHLAPKDEVPVYIINLKRRPDRLEQCVAQFSHTRHITVIEAVDGLNLRVSEDVSRTRGEVGCFLSHLSALRRMLEDGVDHAIVLEDDAIVLGDIRRLLDEVPDGFDVIALGPNAFPKDHARHVSPSLYTFVDYDLYGATGMVYSRAGAQKLLDLARASPSLPTEEPYDLWLTRNSAVTPLIAHPPLVKPRDLQDTDTQRTQ